MALPAEFARLRVTAEMVAEARREYAGFGTQLAGDIGWAGLAGEHAVVAGLRAAGHKAARWESRQADIAVVRANGTDLRLEVKTRVATEGWLHPEKYEWLVIPTHAGREPIKDAADAVVFGWFALEEPTLYWLLGFLRPAEFRRRAVFYREGEPLPRGGWAGVGGAYAIEVRQLRALPRGLVKETW